MNILPWKMVTGLSVRSRPSTLMEGGSVLFLELDDRRRNFPLELFFHLALFGFAHAAFQRHFGLYAGVGGDALRQQALELHFLQNFVPWQTPMVMFWPVMVMRQRSRKPLMGTPSRFISSIISRRPASSSVA